MDLTLDDDDALQVYKALASDTRIDILKLLSQNSLTVSELSQQLGYSKAIISRYMKILEDARLVGHHKDIEAGIDGRKKLYYLAIDHIDINLPKKIFLPYEKETQEIKLGYFSDFSVYPTCGLASASAIIGDYDEPRSFASNNRIEATLLWFSQGYVEYIIPNRVTSGIHPELIEISLELSSEFPDSNNVWPSDISFYLNDIKVGTWTVPGNFSDVRGKLTPHWWEDYLSQYGLLKSLRINHEDTCVDGKKISNFTLEDLVLQESPFIKLKIAVEEDAENRGGLTIFGKDFGNHPQNILYTLYYTENV